MRKIIVLRIWWCFPWSKEDFEESVNDFRGIEVGTMSVEDTWGFLEEEGWIQKPLKQGLLEELL